MVTICVVPLPFSFQFSSFNLELVYSEVVLYVIVIISGEKSLIFGANWNAFAVILPFLAVEKSLKLFMPQFVEPKLFDINRF